MLGKVPFAGREVSKERELSCVSLPLSVLISIRTMKIQTKTFGQEKKFFCGNPHQKKNHSSFLSLSKKKKVREWSQWSWYQ